MKALKWIIKNYGILVIILLIIMAAWQFNLFALTGWICVGAYEVSDKFKDGYIKELEKNRNHWQDLFYKK